MTERVRCWLAAMVAVTVLSGCTPTAAPELRAGQLLTATPLTTAELDSSLGAEWAVIGQRAMTPR